MTNESDGAVSTRQMQLPTTECRDCGETTLKLIGELCSECFEQGAFEPLRGLRAQLKP